MSQVFYSFVTLLTQDEEASELSKGSGAPHDSLQATELMGF